MMPRRPRLRDLRFLLPALLLCSVLTTAVRAHNPHDPIPLLALSPAFAVDEFVLVAQRPAVNWRMMDALVSRTAGSAWTASVQGLENTSALTAVAISPRFTRDGVAILGTESNGLFLSRDQATTWEPLNSPTTAVAWVRLAVSAQGRMVIYVRSEDGRLYRSINRGGTWTEIWSGPSPLTYTFVSPGFLSDQTVLAADEGGLLHLTSDGGDNWEQLTAFPDPVDVTALLVTAPSVTEGEIYVGTSESGLFVSQDAGQTFEAVEPAPWSGPITALGASPDYPQDPTLFLATAAEAVFKSTDGGTSWTHYPVGVELSDQSELHFREFVISSGFAVDSTLFLRSWEGLLRSRDGGETWVELETRPPSLLTGIALSPEIETDSTVAVSSYRGGVMVSESLGAAWTISNVGLATSTVYDIAFGPSHDGTTLLLGTHQDNLVGSLDSGGSWIRRFLAGVSEETIFPSEVVASPGFWTDRTLFAGTRRDGLLISRDGGLTWIQAHLPPAGHRISSVALSPAFLSDPTAFVATSQGAVARSIDGGSSWQPLTEGLPPEPGPVWLAISPGFETDRHLFAGTVAGLYQSFDAGSSWAAVADPVVGSGIVEAVALSPHFALDGIAFLSLRGKGVFKSDDRGASWIESDDGLLEAGVQLSSIMVAEGPFFEPRTVFGIAWNRVARSLDSGRTWSALGLPRVRHEENSQSVTYEGSWARRKSSASSSGGYEVSREIGASATFRFFGTGVSWIGARAPQMGLADVYLDGQFQVTVDLYSVEASPEQTLFTIEGLAATDHVLEVVVAGEGGGGASSLGATIDAFDLHTD